MPRQQHRQYTASGAEVRNRTRGGPYGKVRKQYCVNRKTVAVFFLIDFKPAIKKLIKLNFYLAIFFHNIRDYYFL